MRTLLLFLHIAAVAAWLGAALAQQVLVPRFRRAEAGPRSTYHLGAVELGVKLYTPAAIIVLITGILLVINGDAFSFANRFVSLGFLAVIVGAALGMAFYGPKGRETARLLESGDTDAASRIESRIVQVGMLEILLLLVTTLAMVAKWGVG